MANTATSPAGDRKALDARAFYEQAPLAAALATAHMPWIRTTELGVGWRRSSRGVWEIDGAPEAVLDEFSSRRAAIEAATHELERVIGRPLDKSEVQKLVLKTRQPKQPTTTTDLLEGWRGRAAAHGFDDAALDQCFGGTRTTEIVPETIESLFEHLAGPDGMTATLNVFTRADVIRALIDADATDGQTQPLVLPPGEFVRLADQFLSRDSIVPLDHALSQPHGEPLFTTLELLETQARLRENFARGIHARQGVVPSTALEAVISHNSWLTAEQQHMV